MWFWIVIAAIVAAFYLYKWSAVRKNLPPGPLALPILGNAHQIDFINMHITFDAWRKQYGDIIYARVLGKEMVILNSFDVVKDAFVRQGDNFAARPDFYIFENQSGGRGYFLIEGEAWKEQRRHGLHALRDMGLGRSVQEEKIVEEASDLFATFQSQMSMNESGVESCSLNPLNSLKFSVINIINNILFGSRFNHGDELLLRIIKLVNNLAYASMEQMPMEFIPILRYFPMMFNVQKSIDDTAEIISYFKREIDQHKETLVENLSSGSASDFVYAYLDESERRKKADRKVSSFTDSQLEQNLLDLFIAGFETTATSLSWFILYMIHHPDIQEKMREEIFRSVGTTPCWADRLKLPYCTAVVSEVQRHANIVPFGVFHSCYTDATVAGYKVPKGCIVVPNHWSIMRDERLFENAAKFIPERFIGKDGKHNEKIDGFMPFSIGKRACMGESLAKMELFLFSTALVTTYEMQAPSRGLPSMEPVPQFTLAPQPFEVKLVKI